MSAAAALADLPSPSPAPEGGAALESLADFPSIDRPRITSGESYAYHSPIPSAILADTGPVILGVDEAGRGPVLGPMVYAVAYCLKSDSAILKEHKFDDSKKLKTAFRSTLIRTLVTPGSDLHAKLGWSTFSISPGAISSGMLRSATSGVYNLNAQALDATVSLIAGVIAAGVPVAEVYVDTVGPAGSYQAKLQKLFPTTAVTVSKKADSIYPIVSAASVCAKVTRDAALDVLVGMCGVKEGAMGTGYPGDERTKAWLKGSMEPVFGWSPAMARFSWSTAKDLLEGGKGKAVGVQVEWADDLEEGEQGIMGFMGEGRGMGGWYGKGAGVQMDF